MKDRKHLLVLAFVLIGLAGCAAYFEASPDGPGHPGWRPAPRVEIALFWDALRPYGDWLWVEPWGWVWTPWDIQPGWRPYTEGHWVWTHLGWTWVSDRPWGWAPFHYGRWTAHPHHGWIWIPDTVWAPAWVAWRTGRGWIGWAPLPPQARWRSGFGLELGGLDLGVSILEHGWSFCDERDFLDRRIDRRLAPLPRHAYLLRETRDATRYEEVERRVAVRSFGVEEIEGQVGSVQRYRIEDLDRPPRGGEAVSGGAVRIYRPEVEDQGEGGREAVRRVAPPPGPEDRPAEEPPSAARKKEIERQQVRDLRALRAWEEEQRSRLEKEHQRERRAPRAEETPTEIERRQEEERRALRREVEREKQVLDGRAERKARAREEGAEGQQGQRRQARPKPPGAA